MKLGKLEINKYNTHCTDLHSTLAISKHDQVVSNQIVAEAEVCTLIDYAAYFAFRSRTAIQPKVIASLKQPGQTTALQTNAKSEPNLQVDRNHRVGVLIQIDPQHFLRHIVIVQLVVTEGYVHIQSQVIAESSCLRMSRKGVFLGVSYRFCSSRRL